MRRLALASLLSVILAAALFAAIDPRVGQLQAIVAQLQVIRDSSPALSSSVKGSINRAISNLQTAMGGIPLVCSYTVSPLSFNVAAAGATVSVSVTADAGCSWNVISQAGFITAAPTSGSGNGATGLTVAANAGSSARSGIVTVAGNTVSVTQDGVPPPPPPAVACADGLDNDGDGLIDLADPGCTSPTDTDETDPPPPPPPPPPSTIWGAVDADVLGNCPASTHDRYVAVGPDGATYRTWHPQTVVLNLTDLSLGTCTFAHEHGADPASSTNAQILAHPVLFGYQGHQMKTVDEPNGHAEAHEGYKVMVSNKGARNDEGRLNLHDSRLMFHMGTARPKRFVTEMHSMQYDVVAGDGSGRYAFVQGMADTGGTGSLVQRDASGGAIGKAVMTIGMAPVDSSYEIWAGTLWIHTASGNGILTAINSIAVFDPLTAFDPADPLRNVPADSAEFRALLKFPTTTASFRSCNRESYMGPTYFRNQTGQVTFQTDAMGMVMSGGPLRQEVSLHNTGGSWIATNDGLSQFKLKVSSCAAGLGLKN